MKNTVCFSSITMILKEVLDCFQFHIFFWVFLKFPFPWYVRFYCSNNRFKSIVSRHMFFSIITHHRHTFIIHKTSLDFPHIVASYVHLCIIVTASKQCCVIESIIGDRFSSSFNFNKLHHIQFQRVLLFGIIIFIESVVKI